MYGGIIDMLPDSERIVYAMLCEAADRALICPTYLDLQMEVGCESSSVTPNLVARLERKGLIVVKRYQRFREVQIVATGKWTAKATNMHTDRPHVPRGARQVGRTCIDEQAGTYKIGKKRLK